MKNAQISPRELERRAQDDILVHNPTNLEFIQPFDRIAFKIPSIHEDKGYGEGNMVVPRYVAELYVKNMTDKILGEKQLNAVKEENERRIKNGMKVMDEYMGGEGDNFRRALRIDNESAREEVFAMLWQGVYREYGAGDLTLEQPLENRDNRTFEERMAEKYDKPVNVATPPAANPSQGNGTPPPESTEAVEPAPPATTDEAKNEVIAEVAA